MGSQGIRIFYAGFLLRNFIIVAILAILATPTIGQTKNGEGWELRLGLYDHELHLIRKSTREKGAAINLEVIAPPFMRNNFLEYIRAGLGMSLSLRNKTHLFYLATVFDVDRLIKPFLINISFGIAVHSGKLRPNHAGFNPMGCRWAFHQSLSAGFIFKQHHRLLGTIEHISNANAVFKACTHNSGITNAGLRYGYRF